MKATMYQAKFVHIVKLHLMMPLNVSFTVVWIRVGFRNIARSESLNHIEAELILLTFGLTRKTAGKLWIGVPLHNAYIPTSYYSPRSTFVLSKVQHTSPYLPLRQDQPPTRQDTKHLPTHQHLTTPSKPNISLPPPSQDAKLWCNGLALHRK